MKLFWSSERPLSTLNSKSRTRNHRSVFVLPGKVDPQKYKVTTQNDWIPTLSR